MSHDYYLTEIASTLDLFFKGLIDCGVLVSYSVQLQMSNQSLELFLNIKSLVHQFIKNLQILYSKIPKIKIINNNSDQCTEDNQSLNLECASNVVVICDPLTYTTVTNEKFVEVVPSTDEAIENNQDMKANSNLNVQTDIGEYIREELSTVHHKSDCGATEHNMQTNGDPSYKSSDLLNEIDKNSVQCVLSSSARPDENDQVLLLYNRESERFETDRSKTYDSSNCWSDKIPLASVVDAAALNKTSGCKDSDKMFHIVLGTSNVTFSPKNDEIRTTNDLKLVCVQENKCTKVESRNHLKSMQCCICNLEFTCVESLKGHCQAVHECAEIFTCSVCGKMFITVHEFKRHNSEFHDSNNQYQCEVCNKKFSTKLSLSRHMNIHEGKKSAVCNICGKSFRRSDYLKEHRRMHVEKKIFACKLCPRKFVRKSQLLIHEKVHSGTKDYVCNICKKGFFRSDKLKEHMMRHLNVKRFQCKICDKCYAENRDLKVHIKTHC